MTLSVPLSQRAAQVPPVSACSALPRRKAAVYGCWLLLLLCWSGRLWAQNYIYQRQLGSQAQGLLQLNSPRGVAVDGSGQVYVADTENDRIVKFDSSGRFLLQFGREGSRGSSTILTAWPSMPAVRSTWRT